MKNMITIILMAMLPVVAGCGGGASSPPTTALVKISSQGTLPAGKSVSGFGATIELPAGVTVKTGSGGTVDATVVLPSGLLGGTGNAVMGPVIYTAATPTAKAKLDFTIASASAAGVGAGEYATLTLILSGVSPTATDFTVTSFTPVDLGFAGIPELSSRIELALY